MTATLHAHELAFSHSSQEVLSGVSLALFPGHRVGIVGPNGVGKSTLLRVLAGLLVPDRGSVVLTPPNATVGYLQQEPDRRAGEKVLDYLARVTGVAAATVALQTAELFTRTSHRQSDELPFANWWDVRANSSANSSPAFEGLRTQHSLVRSANPGGHDREHGSQTGSTGMKASGLSRHPQTDATSTASMAGIRH